MKKRLVLIMSGLLPAMNAFSQESAPLERSFMSDPFGSPMLPYYIIFALLFITALLVIAVGVYLLRVMEMMKAELEKGKARRLGVSYVPAKGWWARLMTKVNASVPIEQEKDIELEHNYDGIRELDNHLPPWWKWLFYGTIGWAVVYIFVFHVWESLPLSQQEYQNEIALAEEKARLRKASQPEEIVDEQTLVFTNDAGLIEKGRNVFANNPCGSCHRNDGGGNSIGPNLTDEYWIHGGDVKSIFNTIKNGVVDKGMPAWGKAMSAQDLRDLTFFVMSLQGSAPAEAKGPQGEPFRLTAPLEKDSTSQASL